MASRWGRDPQERSRLDMQKNIDPPQPSSQQAQDSGDSNQPTLLPGVNVGHPVGTIAPPEEAEARAYRAERRDEQRLRVEKAALAVGFLGLVGLLVTLQQTRIATEAATKQLELSERPWVSVDLVATRPLSVDENTLSMWVRFVLKNLGHSPARSAQPHFQMVPISEGYETQRFLCSSEESVPSSTGVRQAIMPGEQVVQLAYLEFPRPLAERADPQDPRRRLLSLAVVGCVSYEFSFAEGFHQTGFFFEMVKLSPDEPLLWFSIEVEEGNFQVDHVGFRKDALGSYAY